MAHRWAIRLAIEGDLRFISHHDCMRAVERVAARAQLPVRSTQGFNPRPIFSLALPRPVAVATRADLMVLTLDEPVEPDDLTARLNAAAPLGMHFDRPRPLQGKACPQPQRIHYELDLGGMGVSPMHEKQSPEHGRDAHATPRERVEAVTAKITALQTADSWPVQRKVSVKHGRGWRETTIDLKPLVGRLELADSTLLMTLQPAGALWPRPGEVLELLGLDGRIDLANLVRTDVEFNFGPPPAPSASSGDEDRRGE
ncbi:MAG: TIGR03936 family radical SAM-associated protein [Planctomycetaceae bacterium]|nr:TIGR03936 family radical SAM-associated protein [Planctomycetaceae bacterium]